MNEDQLAELHNNLVNSKSRRGKFGGIGAGEKHSILLDGPKPANIPSNNSILPDRPLYQRFVMASKKEICRRTVLDVLEKNGGELRWKDLVTLVAQECGQELTRDFKYKVLVNIPESTLSGKTPLVRILNKC